MKNIAILSLLAALAGCQSGPTAADSRWADMRVDIALRHRYEKYSCGYQAMHGCPSGSYCTPSRATCMSRATSKSASVHEPAIERISTSPSTTAQQAYNSVQELSAKIEVLEEALKSNANATNQNEALIVGQIRDLKRQLGALQTSTPAPEPSAPPVTTAASGIKIGK